MPHAIVRHLVPRRSPELQVTYAVPLTDSRVGDAYYRLLGVGVLERGRVRLPDGREYEVYSDLSARKVK